MDRCHYLFKRLLPPTQKKLIIMIIILASKKGVSWTVLVIARQRSSNFFFFQKKIVGWINGTIWQNHGRRNVSQLTVGLILQFSFQKVSLENTYLDKNSSSSLNSSGLSPSLDFLWVTWLFWSICLKNKLLQNLNLLNFCLKVNLISV